MSKDRGIEISSSHVNGENLDMNVDMQVSEEFVKKVSAEKSNQSLTNGVVLQELLHKFQQLNSDEGDRIDHIRQAILLGDELIDAVEKVTSADEDNIRSCIQLFDEEVSGFETVVGMEDYKLFVHEIFFALLDLLSKLPVLSHLSNSQCPSILHQESYQRLINLLLMSAERVVTYVPFTKDDIATRKYTNTLCTMYNKVKYDLQSNNKIEQPIDHDMSTMEYILYFFWNLSDRTVVVPWLLDTGFVRTMVECLKIEDLSSGTARKFIGIVHNISRHDDGAEELRKFDGPSVIKNFQIIYGHDLNGATNFVSSMAIAQISTTEEIRSDNKRMNRILNQLLQITIDAAEDDDHRGQSFHVSEALSVFTKLFVDDNSLEYVLSHAETEPQLTVSSTIALFSKLLNDFQDTHADKFQLKQFTCIALLNILWSISFQDRYKTKLQPNQDLLKIIKSFAMDNSETVVDQYVPHSMESMTKAANGILHNLNEGADRKEAVDLPLSGNASNEKPMVMISYAHDNNSFCDQILTEFEKNCHLFSVWIDRDHCSSSEDLWEKIARGIKQSSLVICLLSQDYFNSRSCRKEASFAVQRKKAIIPVYIGEPGDCDWLDIHIAGLKYVRFKGKSTELDRGKVQELLRTIQSTIKETQTQPSQQQHQTQQHVVPTPSRKETEPTKSISFDSKKAPEEWTADDIREWLGSHKVPDALVKLFDFQSLTEMHDYAEQLRADPKKEFIKYEQRHAKQHAGDGLEEYKFNRFKNALLTLTNNHPRAVKTSALSDRSVTVQSAACTIL